MDPLQAELGRLLFHDKLISGNRDISCATCHSLDHGGTDGISLGIGSGGLGLGPMRAAEDGTRRIKQRIPRNAPALWNLAHKEVHTVFHDGRLSVSDAFAAGFDSPVDERLPEGLKNVLAAQAVFPMVAADEMAGHPGENDIGVAIEQHVVEGWPIILDRIRANQEYAALFLGCFDHIETPADIRITDVANALATFMQVEWTSFDSPFDAYLAGDAEALDADEKRGMALFFGEANCATCHSGPLFTDQSFHAIGVPQFGPGRTRAFDPIPRDVGRMGETDRIEDAYRFKTPALRNVALTAPYGHNGAYPTLRSMVEHHLDPDAALAAWTPLMAELPSAPWVEETDFVIWQDTREMARQAAARDIEPVDLSAQDVSDLVAFLQALTGESAEEPRLGRPARVPSGLPID